MRIAETELDGAYLIDIEPHEDNRGLFARVFDRAAFGAHELDVHIEQCNISWNSAKRTLRGMHYQRPPDDEVKIVRCTRGSIFDVIIDIREGSSTFGRWLGVELNDKTRRTLYVPKGFAHGYQTLQDDTEVFYMTTAPYAPRSEEGIMWNDAAFSISWPLTDPILSDRDRSFPSFADRGVAATPRLERTGPDNS
jgi:dTDP-4-dehydrorhamnose 3,5-epimerase